MINDRIYIYIYVWGLTSASRKTKLDTWVMQGSEVTGHIGDVQLNSTPCRMSKYPADAVRVPVNRECLSIVMRSFRFPLRRTSHNRVKHKHIVLDVHTIQSAAILEV